MRVAIFGATGKTGPLLIRRLMDGGHDVVAVGRDQGRLRERVPNARHAVADLQHQGTIVAALAGAEVVVSLAHAAHAETVLACLPKTCRRVVLTGSVRRYSRLPDAAADAVRDGAAAFEKFRVKQTTEAVWLDPSMIYGAPGDRNVGRILRLLGKWPRWLPVVLPLPAGGQRMVQPVLVDDLVHALVAAIDGPEAPGSPIVVAGPAPMTYARMLRQCAGALGRRVTILPMPVALLAAVARLSASLGLALPVSAAELRRAGEDKIFAIDDLRRRLGVDPRPFAEGLRLVMDRNST